LIVVVFSQKKRLENKNKTKTSVINCKLQTAQTMHSNELFTPPASLKNEWHLCSGKMNINNNINNNYNCKYTINMSMSFLAFQIQWHMFLFSSFLVTGRAKKYISNSKSFKTQTVKFEPLRGLISPTATGL